MYLYLDQIAPVDRLSWDKYICLYIDFLVEIGLSLLKKLSEKVLVVVNYNVELHKQSKRPHQPMSLRLYSCYLGPQRRRSHLFCFYFP